MSDAFDIAKIELQVFYSDFLCLLQGTESRLTLIIIQHDGGIILMGSADEIDFGQKLCAVFAIKKIEHIIYFIRNERKLTVDSERSTVQRRQKAG